MSLRRGATLRAPNSLPDPTRAAGTANSAMPFDHIVVVMMENHSFDNVLGGLSRAGPAARRRTDVQQRRRRAQHEPEPERTGGLVPVPEHLAGAARDSDVGRDARTDRRRSDGRLRDVERLDPADGLLPALGASVPELAGEHLHGGQPLVRLGAVHDVPQPTFPDGGHGVREHRDDPRQPGRPAAAQRHDLRSPPRIRHHAGGTTSPTFRPRASSPRSSRSTGRTSSRSASSSSTARSACFRR